MAANSSSMQASRRSVMGQQTEMLAWTVRHLGEGRRASSRARLVISALADTGGMDRSIAAHCEAGQRLGRRMGMDSRVVAALGLAFQRWDGKGYPNRVPGAQIPASVRISLVARDVELLNRLGGEELVCTTLSKRSGRAYDPSVVEVFLDRSAAWFSELENEPMWEAALDAEPFPKLTGSPPRASTMSSALPTSST